MSALRDELKATESVAAGAGHCDNCGADWTSGPYCPTCGVFALDSHLGRCPDCGQRSEYVNDQWRHVMGSRACFLLPARGRAVRWTFDDDTNAFDGWTDDTYWNGWLNVWVTPETHAQVLAKYPPMCAADVEEEGGLHSLEPGNDGLVCYGWGFCASEVLLGGAK